MAKKRLTDVPSAKSVKQLLAQRKFELAAEEARKLAGFAPGAATAELLRECLFALADSSAERKQYADFNRVSKELEPLCLAAGSVSIRALGRLYLRGLQPGEVKSLIGKLTDAELAGGLRGDLADYFVRTRYTAAIPEEWQPAYAALQTALQHYDAKRDDDAREALNAIGLGSPFLEWKVWLRGLLAWGAEDAGRALENWARLNPQRLPYRLAAPLRSQADAAWLADQPALKEQIRAQYQRLATGGLAGQLRSLRPELAGRTGLAKALKLAEGLLPRLKETHPALVPKLIHVFYHTLLKRGEPGDLDRFVKVFGRVPDDPSFFKLSAQIFEGIDDLGQALQMWASYVDWCEGAAKWPPLLKKQAVAIIYRTMAGIARDFDKFEFDVADNFFAPLRKAKPKKPAAPVPKPSEFLRKALEAVPDWEPAASDLMAAYDDEKSTPAAAAFAEKFLAANPDAMGVRLAYVDVLMARGDYAGSLEQLAPLRKANPFDAEIRGKVVDCVLYCIYLLAIDDHCNAAASLLKEESELLASESPAVTLHLRYSLFGKLKRAAEAEAEIRKIVPTSLVHSFLLNANAQIFKAKPAVKSAAGKAYKAALAADPAPDEVISLFYAYRFFRGGRIEFTGQKAMLKGIVDAMLAAGANPALTEPLAVELIARLGPLMTAPKMEKLAAALGKRFPKHPLFPLCIVELWAETHDSSRAPYKIVNLLRKAKELVRNTSDPAHKVLEARIDDLSEQLDPYATLRNMFDGFF